MVKFSDKCTKIEYNGQIYAVCNFVYKSFNIPVILDYEVYQKFKTNESNWYINDKGYVVTKVKRNDNTICEVYLHDIIMKLENKELPEKKSILHINKINIDNRTENLMYDVINKDIKKNITKKRRIIEFSEDCHITPEQLPSYVWYLNPNGTHGERFIVKVGNVCWKSTASKKLSLRYKLEETKKYLRHMKKNEPEFFHKYSMNGDLNTEGKKLFESFYEISKLAGYTNLVNIYQTCNTDQYLKEDLSNLSEQEIILLNQKFNE